MSGSNTFPIEWDLAPNLKESMNITQANMNILRV